MERLTEEQLNALKAWGDGLAQAGQEEMQAAGRAIQLLIQEIEALHIEFWHERIGHGAGSEESAGDDTLSPAASLVSALLGRARTVVQSLRPG